jgi:multidrug efflux pump subunit AcrA (membrane-fusion protein)
VRGGRVHLQPVTIGQDYGNAVQIVSGLNSNDAVILDPPDSLAEGQPVHVKGETARGQQ